MTKAFTATITLGNKEYTPEEVVVVTEERIKKLRKLRTVAAALTVAETAVAVLAKEKSMKIRAIVAVTTTVLSLNVIQSEIKGKTAMQKYATKTIKKIDALNMEREKKQQKQ